MRGFCHFIHGRRGLIRLPIGFILVLLLVACGGEPADSEPTVQVAVITPTVARPTATVTPSPQPTATATASPSPTPTATPVIFPDGVVAASVVEVIDGVTLQVDLAGTVEGVRYLLLGPADDPAYADEATAQNRALVAGSTVYLEQDTTERDSAGRLLRYVYLPDGRMVNELLVRAGHAQVTTTGPNTRYEERLRMGQADAMLAGLGMWGMQSGTVNRSAALRAGPGTEYEVVGRAASGDRVEVTGRSENGAWYQLADGSWIARFQVDDAPLTLPVVKVTPTP